MSNTRLVEITDDQLYASWNMLCRGYPLDKVAERLDIVPRYLTQLLNEYAKTHSNGVTGDIALDSEADYIIYQAKLIQLIFSMDNCSAKHEICQVCSYKADCVLAWDKLSAWGAIEHHLRYSNPYLQKLREIINLAMREADSYVPT